MPVLDFTFWVGLKCKTRGRHFYNLNKYTWRQVP